MLMPMLMEGGVQLKQRAVLIANDKAVIYGTVPYCVNVLATAVA
jgi:hypothetical protein